ncbi:MAG: hypothetical protein EBU49_02625 [Proteobacteria bacterium]|nr:hypothetical protein [Pseudomonadota bacterium]
MLQRLTYIFATLIFLSGCGPLEQGATTPLRHDLIQAYPPKANSTTWHRPLAAPACLDVLPKGIKEVRSGSHFIATRHANLWTIKAPPHQIKVCDASARKNKNNQTLMPSIQTTFNSIATSHATLSTTFQALTGNPLPEVILDLFPIYEDSRSGETRFVTDNASYDPARSRITLFPPSNDQPGKVRLWAAPFIHAHEMAHHAIDSFRTMKQIPEFRNPSDDEPFADVLAFLALGSKPELIRELPGFGPDRDPSSAFFGDGTPKEFRDFEMESRLNAAVRAHLLWKQISPDDLARVILNARPSSF